MQLLLKDIPSGAITKLGKDQRKVAPAPLLTLVFILEETKLSHQSGPEAGNRAN